MGMFDYLRCDYPLPEPEAQEFEFQTKDLDCWLEHFLITDQGQLIRQIAYGDHAANAIIEHHGDIFFYETKAVLEDGSLAYLGGHDGEWIARNQNGERVKAAGIRTYEYQARFTNGKVEWVKRVSD